MKNNLSLVTGATSSNRFIGQKDAVERIFALNAGAMAAGKVMPHLLIQGPSGCGKTSLTKNLASQIGTNYYEVICHKKVSREDIVYTIDKTKKGDILHFDECHALNQSCQEVLYGLIDSNTIPMCGDVLLTQKAPEITLVFTTNNPGLLRKELRNRLITIELEVYSLDEIKEIISLAAQNGVYV